MSTELPFSEACENNKNPILEVLRRHLINVDHVLEIGGGTGQHAVHFANHLTHLVWQSTEMAENLDSLNLRLLDAALTNLPLALTLDVRYQWPVESASAIFSANCLHIMSEQCVELFFQGVARVLAPDGMLLVYGPFKYRGQFTTESNARFDLWLKTRDPVSGVRDFESVHMLAKNADLTLLEDNAMPANNQLLVWQRKV